MEGKPLKSLGENLNFFLILGFPRIYMLEDLSVDSLIVLIKKFLKQFRLCFSCKLLKNVLTLPNKVTKLLNADFDNS